MSLTPITQTIKVPLYVPKNMTGGQFYDYLFSQPDVFDFRPQREQVSLSHEDHFKTCEIRLEHSMKESSSSNPPPIKVPSYVPKNMTGGQFYDYLFSQPDVFDFRPQREQVSLSHEDHFKTCEIRLEHSMKESSSSNPPLTNAQANIPKNIWLSLFTT